ncbi:MAG: efflux RND transporter periplasmic adaptor subunit [Synergistaceae bacterium]|jgi:RND family efflux transporter MFP subunit|nr:efflux RND transporter periplasmic adaptor subunit [Synergistaceae bacterium]
MRKRKTALLRTIKWAVNLLAAAAAVLGAVYVYDRGAIVSVETAPVSFGPIREVVEDTGSVASRRVTVVSARHSCTITELHVKLGDAAASGDLLLTNDSPRDAPGVRGMRAQAEGLKVRIAQAQKEADRLRSLQRGAASAQDAERALMTVNDLRAQMNAILFDIADALEDAPENTVKSPVSGLITEIFTAQGNTVMPGAPLMEITDTGDLYIKADLIESDAAKVEIGDRVILDASEKEGRIIRIDAKVREVLSELGVTQKRVTAEIETDGYPSLGADVDLSVITDERKSALLVPRKAVFSLNGRDYAFAAAERAELREVEIGLKGKDHYEVLNGLSEGESVIISPNSALRDGSRISKGSGTRRPQ